MPVESRGERRQVVVITVGEGFSDVLADLYRRGYRIVEKIYPYLYLEVDGEPCDRR